MISFLNALHNVIHFNPKVYIIRFFVLQLLLYKKCIAFFKVL